MIRKVLTATVASAAILAAAPALARPGGGGGNGTGASGHAGGGASIGAMNRGPTGLNAGAIGQIGTSFHGGARGNSANLHGSASGSINANGSLSARSNGAMSGDEDFDSNEGNINSQGDHNQGGNSQGENEGGNSQGFDHGSVNGIGNASLHSALGRTAVPSALLPGLTTGLSVQATGGASLGTVTNVITGRNGTVAGVIVTGANGQVYKVPADALSISGNMVTVNTAEAFEKGGVPSTFLPGLATGLTVDTSAGASLGTVTSIQTGKNGAIESLTITDSTGAVIKVPANAVSISGNVVTLNSGEAFERGGVPSSLLPGLTTGATINTSAGAAFGTVSQVLTGNNGTIAGVVVTTSSGAKYVVPASALSVSGNVLTVANASEAFAGTGVPSALLPGLTNGLSVSTAAGASVGTVSQVLTGSNGTIVGVVVGLTNGQTVVLPASDLSISGNAVTVANAGL